MVSFISRVKKSGGIFPTTLDLPEMWRLNSTRCGGNFNILFFWMYPITAIFLITFTLLCALEVALTPEKAKIN